MSNEVAASKSVDSADLKTTMDTLSTLGDLGSGVNSLISGISKLVPMTDSMKEAFNGASAAVNIFVGTAKLLNSVKILTDSLNRSLIGTAVSSVAAKVASNPLQALAIGGALTAATAGVVYYLNQNVYNEGEAGGEDRERVTEYPWGFTTGGWW